MVYGEELIATLEREIQLTKDAKEKAQRELVA